MNISDVAAVRRGVPGGPAGNSPSPGGSVGQQISNPTIKATTNIANMGTNDISPAIFWLTLVGIGLAIRILWQRGGRAGGNIIPI